MKNILLYMDSKLNKDVCYNTLNINKKVIKYCENTSFDTSDFS